MCVFGCVVCAPTYTHEQIRTTSRVCLWRHWICTNRYARFRTSTFLLLVLFSVSVSVSASVFVSVSASVSVSVSAYVFVSISLPISVSIGLSLSRSVSVFVSQCLCLCLCLIDLNVLQNMRCASAARRIRTRDKTLSYVTCLIHTSHDPLLCDLAPAYVSSNKSNDTDLDILSCSASTIAPTKYYVTQE